MRTHKFSCSKNNALFIGPDSHPSSLLPLRNRIPLISRENTVTKRRRTLKDRGLNAAIPGTDNDVAPDLFLDSCGNEVGEGGANNQEELSVVETHIRRV